MVKENTVNEQDIKAWKDQWGKIFKSVIDDETFIWRQLRRKEYVEIMSVKAEVGFETEKIYERQDSIAKLVVLFPSDVETVIESKAGFATTIADEVILKSGFEISSTEAL